MLKRIAFACFRLLLGFIGVCSDAGPTPRITGFWKFRLSARVNAGIYGSPWNHGRSDSFAAGGN